MHVCDYDFLHDSLILKSLYVHHVKMSPDISNEF